MSKHDDIAWANETIETAKTILGLREEIAKLKEAVREAATVMRSNLDKDINCHRWLEKYGEKTK